MNKSIKFVTLGLVLLSTGIIASYLFKSFVNKDRAVLLVFNGKYDQEAENLLASIKKNAPELLPLITICVSDKVSRDFALKHKLSYFELSELTGTGEFASKNYNVMMRRKVEGILYLLKLHKEVLYVDTDVVFLSNPLKQMKFSYDLNIQNDQKSRPYSRAYLCAGFMNIKSTPNTIKFFQDVIAKIIKEDYKINDQEALNYLLQQKPNISVNVLDECRFPNGCRYFDKTDKSCATSDAVIVHNNYIVGIENKRKRFEDSGLLFYSSQG